MLVLGAYAVFAVIGAALYGLLRFADAPRGEAAFLSVTMMLPFFVLTLLVAGIQWLVFSAPVW